MPWHTLLGVILLSNSNIPDMCKWGAAPRVDTTLHFETWAPHLLHPSPGSVLLLFYPPGSGRVSRPCQDRGGERKKVVKGEELSSLRSGETSYCRKAGSGAA